MQTHHITHGVLQDVVPDSFLLDQSLVRSLVVSHTLVFVTGFVAHWWAMKHTQVHDRRTASSCPFLSPKWISYETRRDVKHGLRYVGKRAAPYIGLSILVNLPLVLSIFSLWVVFRDAVTLCILWTIANTLANRTFAVQAYLQDPTPWNFRRRRPAAWKPLQNIAALSDVKHKVLTVNLLVLVAMQAVVFDSIAWALVTLFSVGTATVVHFLVSNELSALVKEHRELIANRRELMDRRYRPHSSRCGCHACQNPVPMSLPVLCPLTVMKSATLKKAKDCVIALVLTSVRVLYTVMAALVKRAILYTIVIPSVAVLYATNEKLTKKVLEEEGSSFFAYAVMVARAILVNVASLGMFLLRHFVQLVARIITSVTLWIAAGARGQLMHCYCVIVYKLGMTSWSFPSPANPFTPVHPNLRPRPTIFEHPNARDLLRLRKTQEFRHWLANEKRHLAELERQRAAAQGFLGWRCVQRFFLRVIDDLLSKVSDAVSSGPANSGSC